jgi:hypothetical protein
MWEGWARQARPQQTNKEEKNMARQARPGKQNNKYQETGFPPTKDLSTRSDHQGPKPAVRNLRKKDSKTPLRTAQ